MADNGEIKRQMLRVESMAQSLEAAISKLLGMMRSGDGGIRPEWRGLFMDIMESSHHISRIRTMMGFEIEDGAADAEGASEVASLKLSAGDKKGCAGSIAGDKKGLREEHGGGQKRLRGEHRGERPAAKESGRPVRAPAPREARNVIR